MIYVLPDLHPGRCINTRPSRDAYGYPVTERCLEYEGETHVCRFPLPPPLVKQVPIETRSWSSNNDIMQPKPWVRPD